MPILNFQKRFADLVKFGIKQQTIRAPRKHPIKLGDRIYLYTGLRTKYTRKLGEGICSCAEPIIVDMGTVTHEMASADGFDSPREMLEWFKKTHGLPFNGILIKWRNANAD